MFEGTQLSAMYGTGGLYGSGIVTNDTRGQSNRTMGFVGSDDPAHPAVFSGKFVNKAYFCPGGNGYMQLTGTDSTAEFGMINWMTGGWIGIMKFGNEGSASSWGNAKVQWRAEGNHVVYLGTGETASRSFYYGDSGKFPELDAGE